MYHKKTNPIKSRTPDVKSDPKYKTSFTEKTDTLFLMANAQLGIKLFVTFWKGKAKNLLTQLDNVIFNQQL